MSDEAPDFFIHPHDPANDIPVRIGERVIGYGWTDEDGFFHMVITDPETLTFMSDNHQYTGLSVGPDYAEVLWEGTDD